MKNKNNNRKNMILISCFSILLFSNTLHCQLPDSVRFQPQNLSVLSSDNNNNISTNDTNKTDTKKRKIKVASVPYPFYSNLFKLGIGGFVSISGLTSENSLLKAGGFVSTNASVLGYFQYEEFQMPGFQRLFIRPDLLFGKLGNVKNYCDLSLLFPQKGIYSPTPGTNNSNKDDYYEVDGIHQWYEFTFGYLLPIGNGKDHVVANPVLENGILVDNPVGGYSMNPFKSGRTFLQAKLIYRRLDMKLDSLTRHQTASGIEYILNVENVDYIWNPTKGYTAKVSYLTDWNFWGGDSKYNVVKADLSYYIPFSQFRSPNPSVLALNIKTAHTLSWNDYDVVNYNYNGHTIPIKNYHRPPNFMGAFLGGPKTLRGYLEYRFYDCSSLFYAAEFRHILSWNPFNNWSLTRKLGVDWLEVAGFGELGRVAPYWNLKTFHQDMKWDVGTGLRVFFNGFLVRLDAAVGKEGLLFQMFYDYSF